MFPLLPFSLFPASAKIAGISSVLGRLPLGVFTLIAPILMTGGQSSLAETARVAPPTLQQGFVAPPEETKPWCYWYWLNGHISREGITRDLEAMKNWGIGRAIIGDIYLPSIEQGPIKDLSEEYFAMLEHAVREGGRIGVDISVFNCPGWSQTGGPWIKPEQSMRYLATTERRINGPSVFEEKLPGPEKFGTAESPASQDALQDFAVLAFPAPRGDTDTLSRHKPKVTSNPAIENITLLGDGKLETAVTFAPPADGPGKASVEIDMTALEPFTARSLTIYPPLRVVEPKPEKAGAFDADCELLAEQEDGTFRSVHKFPYRRIGFRLSTGPMPRGPTSVSFPAVTAKRFRLVFKNITLPKGNSGETTLAEIELSGGARVEKYIEQQLGDMSALIQPSWDYYLWKTQAEPDDAQFCIDPTRIVDLTGHVGADGTLKWNVPAGEWVIVRLVLRPTGVQNKPASKEGTGIEADKMSPAAMVEHYKNYVGKLVARFPKGGREALKGLIIDSYEVGPQNWTDEAREKFTKSFGYDPMPWLPVLTGRLVGNADQSTRFLWDLRRFVADEIAQAYKSLGEAGHRDGLQFWLEPYGHFGFPAEYLLLASAADGVGGEFWLHPEFGDTEVLAASSAAHIYGKNIVSSEAFTANASYGFTQDPWSLKALGDLEQTLGINHFVLSVYIHQPDERAPGMNAWFGTELNRHNTWYDFGKPWIDYLRRSHFLLQQGHYAADVAYFIGEDAPKMAGVREPPLPAGYLADDINADVIRRRMEVKDGRFVLPDGMSYRLLVLPPLDTIRPEVLEKIRNLVMAGGAVLGPPPSRSPSLQDYPKADQKVAALAQEIWGSLDGKTRRQARLGTGWVFQNVSVKEALEHLHIPSNITGVEATGKLWTGGEGPILRWTHRSLAEGEIFFLSNQQDQIVSATPSFRASGKQPELWDPVTGQCRPLPDFKEEGGRTLVPLQFAPRQSLFIVFRTPIDQRDGKNFPTFETVGEIDTPWTVTFDPQLGGPPSAVVFEKLEDWTKRPEPEIRNYSGPAVYQNKFDLPPPIKGQSVYLDLGAVSSLARVKLNGKDLGVVWCAPWRLDLGSAALAVENKLEIEVVNPWINRLLADEKLPKDQRIAWLASPAVTTQKPLPAGLLGPVKIQVKRN